MSMTDELILGGPPKSPDLACTTHARCNATAAYKLLTTDHVWEGDAVCSRHAARYMTLKETA